MNDGPWEITRGDMEAYAIALLYGGLALAALAWIWLIVRAFQEEVWWGLASLIPAAAGLGFRIASRTKGDRSAGSIRSGWPGYGGPRLLFVGGSGRLGIAWQVT